MGFEKRVLAVVSEALEEEQTACFKYGTLFVLASPAEAQALLAKLRDELWCDVALSGPMNYMGWTEYAYDFTIRGETT